MGFLASIAWNAFWLVGPPVGLGEGDRKKYLLWGLFALVICGAQAFWALIRKIRELEHRLRQSGPRIYVDAYVDYGDMGTPFILTNRGESPAHRITILFSPAASEIYFPPLDYLAINDPREHRPEVQGVLLGHHDLLPVLSKLWERDMRKRGEPSKGLKIPFSVEYTDQSFSAKFVSECELVYDEVAHMVEAQRMIAARDRIVKNIIKVNHVSFKRLQ